MRKLSLIIPIYNEEKTLEKIVSKVLKLENDDYFKNNDLSLEIILVDDFSYDSSYEIAKKLSETHENIKYYQNEKNLGKGASIKNGFLQATGDFIGIQDADDEYNPFDYIKLLKPLIEDKADVVYGSRYLKRNSRRVLYFWHTYMNKFLTFLTNMYTNLDITDMETCYKLFRKDVVEKIAPKLKENRFGFEPEITIYVAQEKYRLYECAISYNPRTYEEGKKIKPKDGLRAIYCILHYGAHNAPVPMQFLLYFFIGGFSAVVNILAFMLLINFISDLRISVGISFILSALINYLLCILLLFKHKARWSSFGEILAYILTLIVMGGFDYLFTKIFILIGVNNFFSKALSSLLGLIGNFLFRKYFVFFEKNKTKPKIY